MRILLAAGCIGDPNQGVAGSMFCLAEKYRAAGHEVRFHFRSRQGRFAEVVFGLCLAISRDAWWADIVDVHAVDAWPLCSLPLRPAVVARSHGLEVVVHRALLEARRVGSARIALPYWFYRGSLRLWFERLALRNSDASIVLNEGDRGIALEDARARKGRVQLHPNGFPDEFLDHPVGSGRGIAFIGSWLPRKGNDIAIHAISSLLRQRPDLPPVLLAGTGQSREIVVAQFPEEVRSRIRVVERFDRSDFPMLLREVGILLFPSRSEGYPLALAEAMACGVAPVASRIPGVVEMVDHPDAGVLVDLEEGPDGFAAAAAALLDDSDRWNALRHGARARIRDRSWGAVAKVQLEMYAEVLRARGGSR